MIKEHSKSKNKMRILMIDFQDIYAGSFGSLGLASILDSEGHDVKVVGDISIKNILDLRKNELEEVIREFCPDVVGLSVMTPNADYITPVSKAIKAISKYSIIIIGGLHATIFKENVLLENPLVDYLFYSDADKTLPLFLSKLSDNVNTFNDVIPGLIYYKDNKLINGGNPPLDFELDDLPFVNEELIDVRFKEPALFGAVSCVSEPSRYILGTRGCPYSCSFCQPSEDGLFRKKVRYRSPESIIKEIQHLKDKYKINAVAFLDDNLTLSKKRYFKLMQLIRDTFPKLEWWGQFRANLVDEEIIYAAKKSGCKVATVTVESGNDRVRVDVLNKKITKKQLEKAFSLCKKHGLLIQSTLMVGSPTETLEELNESINFIMRLDPDWVGVCHTMIIPGTQMFEKYKGKLDYDRYSDFQEINIISQYKNKKLYLHNIEPKKFLEIHKQLKRRYNYYRRVSNIFRNIKRRHLLVWQINFLVKYLNYYQLRKVFVYFVLKKAEKRYEFVNAPGD